MTTPQETDQLGGLKPPQFRLATLMWLVGFLCAVFAAMAAIGPLAAWGLVLLVLAIFAHVAGNSLGTKLRDSGDKLRCKGGAPFAREPRSLAIQNDEFVPATNLSQRYSLGITTFVTTGSGAILGIALGGGLLALTYWGHLTWLNVTVAGLASGVLGGLLGFLVSGFVHVTLVAYLQATRHEERK